MTEATSNTYVPPSLCVGSWTLTDPCSEADALLAESLAAESLEIAGAPINVFKLLGVHEQGSLIDLTGEGAPISGGTDPSSDVYNAFNSLIGPWVSAQAGPDVVLAPAYLGYNFGTKKTSAGTERYAPSVNNIQHITTIKIQQGALPQNRVLQARLERATGQLIPTSDFSGAGNGNVTNLQVGYGPHECVIFLTSISASQFTVSSSTEGPLPNLAVGEPYACRAARLTVQAGSIPFQPGDTFTVKLSLDWKRSDVFNLPDSDQLETIHLKASAPATYWRIVPILFSGNVGDPWEIHKLEMMDYQATSIDNIQDTLFLENRDRDYAQASIMLRCQYQPFDSVGDLGKFGFSILDQYIFTCSFAKMVEKLGRPIVIGDVLEICPELAYDQHLRPVKKYLEVSDVGWSSEGFSAQWKPVLYRFQAVQLLPSAEVRDIIKTPEEELYRVSDGDFFDQITRQVQVTPTLVTETIGAEATDAAPERGEDLQDIAFVEDMQKVSFEQTAMYIEDGLPPNGEPYGEGYTLPNPTEAKDGDYFRLNYPADMNIPPRLYKFSLIKGKWIYIETDRRDASSSHKPSVRNALVSLTKKSLQDKL